MPEDVELTVVTLTLEATDEASAGKLLGVLAKYVVIARGQEGCRNIDLVASVTHAWRYLLVEKWDSPDAQRTHFDSPAMVEMAESCRGLLARPPVIDLWDNISAHDLA